jgi:prolyl 4-hydroxylase
MMAKHIAKTNADVKAKEAPPTESESLKNENPVNVVKLQNDSQDGAASTTTLSREKVVLSSLSMRAGTMLVAILALVAGIVTPTLWNILHDYSSLSTLATQQERKMVETSTTITTQEQPVPAVYACTEEDVLADYLHDFSIPGLHVICLHTGDASNVIQNSLTMFPNAQHTKHAQFLNLNLKGSSTNAWPILRDALVEHLELTPTDDLHQPWAIFSPTGERILDEVAPDDTQAVTKLQELGMFLIYQGGQWLWPPVRKGFQRHVRLDDTHNATLETLSIHPLVLSVHGFLSSEECDYIQQQATPSMQYSSVTLMDHDKGRPASDFRTSQSTFLSSSGKDTLQAIDDRTASLVRIPKSHQEYAQVLRYGYKEKYDTHHDYFEPSLYQNDARTLNLIGHGRRNRMATVFWYLTNVEQGGETVFPRLDKGPDVHSSIACEQQSGLRVKPERGKVIIFYNLTPEGKTDTYSLHGACPVKEGIKWAANKWVWNEAMGYMR